jgi:hypothetical protein
MTKTFTENDLLRYVYGETSKIENIEIGNALICDEQLQESYNHLVGTLSDLDKCVVQPSVQAIQGILDYSRSSNLHLY